MTTRQEEERLYEASRGIADVFNRSFPLHAQEALLHEVCHAAALGIRWTKNAPDRVSAHFDSLNGRSKLLGLAHEAQCFAIEHHAVRILGWQRRIPMKKIKNDVWENGHSGKSLSKKDFFLMIKRFMLEHEAENLAVEAVGTMLRMARSKNS